MHLPMATVVTTTLVAARGGVPGALACAGRGFVHRDGTQTPCNPIRCPDEQASRATNRTQASGSPPHPQGTHPSIPNLADGWQACSKALTEQAFVAGEAMMKAPVAVARHIPR